MEVDLFLNSIKIYKNCYTETGWDKGREEKSEKKRVKIGPKRYDTSVGTIRYIYGIDAGL